MAELQAVLPIFERQLEHLCEIEGLTWTKLEVERTHYYKEQRRRLANENKEYAER